MAPSATLSSPLSPPPLRTKLQSTSPIHPPSPSPSLPSSPTLPPPPDDDDAPLFSPAQHLDFSPPSSILTMNDLGLPPSPISPIATTSPFPLLSRDAVLRHRREILDRTVLASCMHHTRPGSVQIRGMASDSYGEATGACSSSSSSSSSASSSAAHHEPTGEKEARSQAGHLPRRSSSSSSCLAPFIRAFWRSPEVLAIVSSIAGVDLVPAMDYEIAHANVQLGPDGVEGVWGTPVVPPEAAREPSVHSSAAAEENGNDEGKKKKPVIEWHRDSHPWVCVVMLSDARYMEGGETEIMRGDGTTIKTRSPQMGHAVLLQGRHILHTALPALNMPERITVVTSFRPRDPLLYDGTTNANVRNKSHLPELHYQWTLYRLEVMVARAEAAAKGLRRRYMANFEEEVGDKAGDREGEGGKVGFCVRRGTVDVDGEFKEWCEELVGYVRDTMREMGGDLTL